MSRQPHLDKKLLDELRDNRRTGAPGQNSAQQAQQQPPQPQQQQPNGQELAQAQPSQQRSSTVQSPPQAKPDFGAFRMGAPSASSAIEEAARATALSRGRGVGGDYGNGLANPNTSNRGDLEVLSDTMGVDFAPYLQRVLQAVRVNWYNLIPEIARPPLLKQGKVAVEFQINKSGGVEAMHLVGPSGDVSLDRAAWGGITASNPFPPLPHEFRGENIALRFHFYYNPDRGAELR